MAVNYEIDEEGILKKMVVRVMKQYEKFRILTNLKFLFVWRLGDPEYDKESCPIIAMVRKLPTRERDIYLKDVELRVHQGAWNRMSDKQRFRVVFHELLHINIELDESMQPQGDDDGRIVFKMANHDVLIRTFQEEIDLFGLPVEYKRTVEVLTQKRVKEDV